MKRVVIGIAAVIITAGGAYAISHKSSKPAASSNSSRAAHSSAAVVNNAVLVTKTSSSLGRYLADPRDMALYTYNADSKNVSNCTGSCLQDWAPYIDKVSTTSLPPGVGTTKRTDNGAIQYTYNGMPLYYFSGDVRPGQVTGNGVQDFRIAKPATASTSSPDNPATPPASTNSQSSSASSSSGSNW